MTNLLISGTFKFRFRLRSKTSYLPPKGPMLTAKLNCMQRGMVMYLTNDRDSSRLLIE
jgi:hypothetical protein